MPGAFGLGMAFAPGRLKRSIGSARLTTLQGGIAEPPVGQAVEIRIDLDKCAHLSVDEIVRCVRYLADQLIWRLPHAP